MRSERSTTGRGRRDVRPALLCALTALLAGACSSDGDEPPPRLAELATAPTVLIERPGYRLRHPETWTVDTDAPGYDPDSFLVLQGPDGATVAVMMLAEPADPRALVDAILAEHGLVEARERELSQWGQYEGYGRDLFGLNEAGVPAGMRAFAFSSDTRSFLVAETYVEYAYAAARQGFDAVELSFTLLGDDAAYPGVALGSRVFEDGRAERWLVRPDFELRFPDDWRVDTASPDYDPDASFTLLTPIESSWLVVQMLEGAVDAKALLADARLGLEPVLTVVDGEERFDTWGTLKGRGLRLHGGERGLPATLRIFVHARDDQALLVTEFWYDEVRPRLAPGFARVAETFRFRR